MNDSDRRSEAIEREAPASLHAHCPAKTRAELGLFFEEVADAVVVGATMTARIRAALDHGCTALYTETGEAVAGDPQHPCGNIERYAFAATRLRQKWAPPKT